MSYVENIVHVYPNATSMDASYISAIASLSGSAWQRSIASNTSNTATYIHSGLLAAAVIILSPLHFCSLPLLEQCLSPLWVGIGTHAYHTQPAATYATREKEWLSSTVLDYQKNYTHTHFSSFFQSLTVWCGLPKIISTLIWPGNSLCASERQLCRNMQYEQ